MREEFKKKESFDSTDSSLSFVGLPNEVYSKSLNRSQRGRYGRPRGEGFRGNNNPNKPPRTAGQTPNQASRWILASLLLHLFLGGWMYLQNLQSPKPSLPPEVELTTLDELQRQDQKKTPLLEKTQPKVAESKPTDDSRLDPNATILSDKTQTARVQTRANRVDDFQTKQGTGVRSTAPGHMPPTADQAKQTHENDPDGLLPKQPSAGVKRDWKSLSMNDLTVWGNGKPTAATDDRLDNIAPGEETVLSTREFQYYSYYHRIKQSLRQYWKPNVERKIALIWSRGAKLKDDEMVTRLLVMLDEKGGVSNISRMNSSGVEEIDEAAIDAFNRAAPFPNPPKGLVERDGLVRIQWEFILKASGGPQIQYRRPGQ